MHGKGKCANWAPVPRQLGGQSDDGTEAFVPGLGNEIYSFSDPIRSSCLKESRAGFPSFASSLISLTFY